MIRDLSVEEVASIDDTDVLWDALGDARERGELAVVRAIENRMRELGQQRRFAHLDDDQLLEQIRGLSGNREPEDLLAYSPASGEGHDGADGTAALNRGIRANQHDGIEVKLAALVDEWERRRSR